MCLSGLFSGLNAIYMTVWMDCLIWLYACLYELYICLDGLCACLDGLHLSRQTVFLSEWILNQIVYFALVVIYEMGGHTSLFLFLFLLIRLAYDYDSMRLSYLHYSCLWLFITFYWVWHVFLSVHWQHFEIDVYFAYAVTYFMLVGCNY